LMRFRASYVDLDPNNIVLSNTYSRCVPKQHM
jgi:hypothetical protein